jgi:hypothetical protein
VQKLYDAGKFGEAAELAARLLSIRETAAALHHCHARKSKSGLDPER